MNALEITKATVKCDNKPCDWTHEITTAEEANKYVNTKCPKCHGERVVLTDDEAEHILNLFELVDIISANYGEVPEDEPVREITIAYKDTHPDSLGGK